MRRLVAVGLAVVAGAATLTACASDPMPTDVKVAWAPAGRSAVVVTWKDNNAPNRITIEGVLSEGPSYVKYIPAGAPNRWEIPTSAFPPDGNYKVAVATGTSQSGVTSKLARSAVFDTDGPVMPNGAGATPRGRGVLVKWSVPSAPQDFTPNDPLDVKGTKTQKYVPMIGRPGELLHAIGPGTTSTHQVIKSIKPPYVFQLQTQNEWSSRLGGQVLGVTSSVNAAVPSLAQFSVTMRIRGRVVLQTTGCEPETPCTKQRATPAGVPLIVQTQVTPGARWTPAARGSTTAGGYYDIAVTTGASRPYKVVVPAYSKAGVITGSSTSKPSYTQSVVRIQSAGFVGGEKARRRNSAVTVFANVKPAMNSTAILQVWNRITHKWVNVKATPVRKGQTSYVFTAAHTGDYIYRFLIPNAMMLGRRLNGTVTPHLPLHIR